MKKARMSRHTLLDAAILFRHDWPVWTRRKTNFLFSSHHLDGAAAKVLFPAIVS